MLYMLHILIYLIFTAAPLEGIAFIFIDEETSTERLRNLHRSPSY